MVGSSCPEDPYLVCNPQKLSKSERVPALCLVQRCLGRCWRPFSWVSAASVSRSAASAGVDREGCQATNYTAFSQLPRASFDSLFSRALACTETSVRKSKQNEATELKCVCRTRIAALMQLHHTGRKTTSRGMHSGLTGRSGARAQGGAQHLAHRAQLPST